MIKRYCLLIIIFIVQLASIYAQEQFVGRWWLGMIEEAMLPINLTFEEKDSAITAVLYSPMQTHEAIYPSKYSFDGNQIIVEQKQLNAKLKLTYLPETDTWKGTFKQGMVFKIIFEPSDGLLNLDRPQTPKRPLPYIEEEVTVKRRKEKVTLTGTLTMPKEGKDFPAVVLVNGSGQQNRDSEIFGHKTFAVLSDYLTRQGIAVLRYDDRGMGGSKGDIATATTKDFAEDAMAMAKWLRKHKNINRNKVGIIGHSEGGLIAQMVATEMKDLGFIVMMAGPGCSGKEVLLQQNEAIFRLQGTAERLIKARVNYMRAVMEGDSNAEEILKPLTKEERKEIGLNRGATIQLKKQLEMEWMKTFMAIDPAQYLSKIDCPILALNGDKDCQVIATENLKTIKQNAPHAETIMLPNLNHLMQHCKTGNVKEYISINETLAEEVMDIIANWIKKLEK